MSDLSPAKVLEEWRRGSEPKPKRARPGSLGGRVVAVQKYATTEVLREHLGLAKSLFEVPPSIWSLGLVPLGAIMA